MTNLPRALSAYADRFHAELEGHHVGSPLGAWMLLAAASTAARGAEQRELESALGMSSQEARSLLGELLGRPHAAIAVAAAAWGNAAAVTEQLVAWAAGLPDGFAWEARMPGQSEVDEWARRSTNGQIEEFPLAVNEETALVLASALVTEVTWRAPFEVVGAEALGSGAPLASGVRKVLRATSAQECLIAVTARAGDVAVVSTQAREDVLVVSVAAEPGVERTDVLAAAHEVALSMNDDEGVTRRDLFELELGRTALWEITEKEKDLHNGRTQQEHITAALPAWAARSSHDLLKGSSRGMEEAGNALMRLLELDPSKTKVEAAQEAVATFSRTGFEAAAVTALVVPLSGAPTQARRGVQRTASLRFAHPHAVVAVALEKHFDRVRGEWVTGPWHGVPVFSAWVAEAVEAE